jgi:hypothetical protein
MQECAELRHRDATRREMRNDAAIYPELQPASYASE